MHRRLLLIGALSLLAGCATAAPPIVAPAGSSLGELEPLYSASAGREALTIRVASNGCTKKEDFAFFVERKGDAVTLAFGRKRLDPCRSFAMGHTDLTFTYAELGVAGRTPLFMLNPFYPWTGPGS
ncbi:hypothetical protein [Phenylobacterium ferrooxidans]|uniref:Lipoprotein n=1 Tax=Phenylobacterium ferrooxidans TaxID=2982689 RepID=A0ABW6CJY1_9CAUL